MNNREKYNLTLPLLTIVSITIFLFMACSEEKIENPSKPFVPQEPEYITQGLDPTLSPDGTQLVCFLPTVALRRYNMETGITDTININGVNPCWLPSDSLILFTQNNSLVTFNVESQETTVIYSHIGGSIDNPCWSPDMSEIAFSSESGSSVSLAIVSYPEGNLAAIDCNIPVADPCLVFNPSWTPDGEWNIVGYTDGIARISRSNDSVVSIIDGIGWVTDPAISPNGKWIAFSRYDPSDSVSNIWVVDYRGSDYGLWEASVKPENSNCYNYGLGRGCWQVYPCWSSDSRTIYFSSNQNNNLGIYKITFEP